MTTVSFRNISKSFANGKSVITDFNLEIADGELLVIIGPSGCGKSTLLRLLAGLEVPSSGELLLDDERVNEKIPQQRNIAMVFQNYALYPHMTVRANLAFPLKMMALPKADINRRVTETAQLLELETLLERKPKQLSGGQRQRVAMGRAIVRAPNVFLMDEPLSNLDASLRVHIRSEIASLQRRMQITMLYVTHDQVEAMTLGDRVAVLNHGRLQQVATPQTLYDWPANIFVAGFIGNPGMNIVKSGLVINQQNHLALCWGKQLLPLADAIVSQWGLLAYVGKPVLVGLRPEVFCIADSSVEDCSIEKKVGARVPVKIEMIETLGHECLCYFHAAIDVLDSDYLITGKASVAPRTMIARLPKRVTCKPGESIELEIAMDHLHFFDESGCLINI